MPDTTPLVRIEVAHPVTDEPTWLLVWDGASLDECRLPDADPEAGDIRDWTGPNFLHEGWREEFAKWAPEEVAEEIIDQHHGAGFNARLLSAGSPA